MAKEKTEKNSVPRCLSLAVIKPINCTWDEAGKVLRIVQASCVGVANATQSLLVGQDIRGFQSTVVNEDGYLSIPKDGKKLLLPPIPEKVETAAYAHATDRFPKLATRGLNYITQEVCKKYKRSRFHVITAQRSAATFRSFPFQTDRCRLLKQENGDYHLDMTLLSRKEETLPQRITFLLDTFKCKQADVLKRLAEQDKVTTRLIYNRRKNKWMAQIFHDLPFKQRELLSDRVLHVYPPGGGKFLKCSYFKNPERKSPDDVWSVDIEFESALNYINAYESRMKKISMKYAQDSSTAGVGRGRKRAIKNKSQHQDKYKRACTTFNQQRAAFIVQTAIRWQCAKIEFLCPKDVPRLNLIDQWPWYQLEQCIANKAKENKIEFEKVGSPEEYLKKLEETAEKEQSE